jgi:hypothetical protein
VSSVIKYLPPINELKSLLKKNPELINYYKKTEGFIGDYESVKYIQSFIKNSNKIV